MPRKKKIQLSATRISTFLQCKKRYWLGYVERSEKLENPAFKLGLACHTALEFAGNMWRDQNLSEFSEEQKKEILDVYNTEAIKEGVDTYAGFLEGRDLVSNRVNNFAIGKSIVGLEIKFGFKGQQEIKTANGVSLIGAIDKVVEFDESTLLVIDYKTSMTVPDGEKLKTDVQLSMYNLVAKQLFPEYKRIILGLDMLRKGDIVYTYRTDEELDVFEEYLTAVHAEMSSIKKADAKANINFLCGWCDFRNICEEYNAMCAKKDFNFLSVPNMPKEELMKEWEHVRASKKILETRESELADAMIEHIKVKELPLQAGDKEMTMRQNSRTTYDPIKVSKHMPVEDFATLVNLSPTKLRKYLDKNAKIKPFIEELAETNYTSAFLATRKARKKK